MLRMAVQIHWFSIINSCVTVLLLTGFLATILMRVLKNDFIKYTRDDDGALHLWLCNQHPGQSRICGFSMKHPESRTSCSWCKELQEVLTKCMHSGAMHPLRRTCGHALLQL